VGAADARRCLPEGCEVTVDAEERNVYKGLIEALLRYRSVERGGVSSEPEYKTLRQMLRWIVPLRLIDPESPEFVVSNCESLHDIIHFSHEKAVEEIVNLRERHSHLRRYQPHVLDVDIPIHLVMLDMGGGLSREIGQRVPVSDVRSVPFNAFLRGVLLDDVWERQPSRLSLKSVVSGMDRTQRMLTDQPEFVGQNLAIIAHNYMNLSLRLGYHFNVIDTYLSESVNENYIYFRFVGGFADPLKRKRRVELIKRVLERFNFKVKIKGDLVVGKLKMEEIQVMEGVLEQIGKLVAFTRQLDVKLASNGNVDSFYQLFLKKMENQLVDPFL
jgi:pyruvate,water dikinase